MILSSSASKVSVRPIIPQKIYYVKLRGFLSPTSNAYGLPLLQKRLKARRKNAALFFRAFLLGGLLDETARRLFSGHF